MPIYRPRPLFGGVACATLLSACLAFALARNADAAAPAPQAPAAAPSSAPPAGAADIAPAPSVPPYEFQPGVVCPLCALTPQFPVGRSGLHWHDHWRHADVREYVVIPALAASAIALRLLVPPATHASWTGPVLFDTPVRDALRVKSVSGRRTAAKISDGLFVWEVVHPTVIDPLLVAWWQRESPFVAWQMLVIDAQAYAFTFLLTDVVKRATARQRPWVATADCQQNPNGSECGSGGSYMSFYSGHAAVTATGAGLLCAHHTQLRLYQSDLLDKGTCALAVLGTAVTGAMRIAADDHWASDVIIGHLVGYTSGYLLPTLLYYKEFRSQPHDHPVQGTTYAALPMITQESLGLSVLGAF
jgi:membrane-associated phospholipid phosphatase